MASSDAQMVLSIYPLNYRFAFSPARARFLFFVIVLNGVVDYDRL